MFVLFSSTAWYSDGGQQYSGIRLGTGGLTLADTGGTPIIAWGTVLEATEEDVYETHAEEDDWGNLIAVGLTGERAQVTLICRLMAHGAIPRPGDRFQFHDSAVPAPRTSGGSTNKTYTVLRVVRRWQSGAVVELAVTGARWAGLGSTQLATAGPATPGGYGG